MRSTTIRSSIPGVTTTPAIIFVSRSRFVKVTELAQMLLLLAILVTTLFHEGANAAAVKVHCGRQRVRNGRIVGGSDAYDGEFPWTVSIRPRGRHFCGGAILNERWILTAAHCLVKSNGGVQHQQVVIRVGEHDMSQAEEGHQPVDIRMERFVIHPDYSRPRPYSNDVALIRLSEDIAFNEFVSPVCLPPKGKNYEGEVATVVGWGYRKDPLRGGKRSDRLQKVAVPVMKTSVCESWFREAHRNVRLEATQMCAGYKSGGKDACQGDSGGPLVLKEGDYYSIIGVVSVGIGCADPLLPGVYSRIPSFIPWIEKTIREN